MSEPQTRLARNDAMLRARAATALLAIDEPDPETLALIASVELTGETELGTDARADARGPDVK